MDGLTLDRLGRATVLIALGLGMASAMVSASFRTANFADGSLYLFAALTPDPWGILWFNFPLRASVFVFEIVPSWLAVRLTGDAVPVFFKSKLSPHQIGLCDVLATLDLLGRAPKYTAIVGVQPLSLALGMELSAEVESVMPALLHMVVDELAGLGIRASRRTAGVA